MSMQDTQKTLTNYSLNVCAVPTYILEAFYLTFMYLKPCSYETVHKQGVSRCGQLYLFFKFMPKLTYFRKMFRSLIFCAKFSLRLFSFVQNFRFQFSQHHNLPWLLLMKWTG